MAKSNGKASSSEPLVHQRGRELQAAGSVVRMPIGLELDVCKKSASELNQILADTCALRDLYKQAHWHVTGHTFYALHLLFDKHYEEQDNLVDMIAERIQLLGGLAAGTAWEVAEATKVERPESGREEVPAMISRLSETHATICKNVRKAAGAADDRGDDGTNDLLISNVLRTNELQAWFLSEHVVDTPLVKAD